MEDLNIVMNQKYDRLQSYLKDKLNDKRINTNRTNKFAVLLERTWHGY